MPNTSRCWDSENTTSLKAFACQGATGYVLVNAQAKKTDVKMFQSQRHRSIEAEWPQVEARQKLLQATKQALDKPNVTSKVRSPESLREATLLLAAEEMFCVAL